MIPTKKINDVRVEPVVNPPTYSKKTVLGYDWFKNPYANVALIARKNSGKSCLIYNCLEKCVGKDCNVLVFSSTVHHDATYKKTIKMLEKKGANVKVYEHFIENGVNHIEVLLKILVDEKKNEGAVINGKKTEESLVRFNNIEMDDKKKKMKQKKKKSKILKPEWVFVFDDLSSEMNHPSITKLLTKNRHFLSKTFIALHNVTNLHPSGLRMVDNIICFQHISEDKIDEIADKCGIHFAKDRKGRSYLNELYKEATKNKYNFLYIDKEHGEYRHNFDKMFLLNE